MAASSSGVLPLALLLLSFPFASTISGGAAVPLQLINDDILGLIVFKSLLHDPFSRLSSWKPDDSSPCSWHFIRCRTSNSRVSAVSLDGLALSGNVADAAVRSLPNLRHLAHLSLSRNAFTGPLLPEIALIPNLRSLNLSHNFLSGPIPPALFTNATSIRSLDLSNNSLSGTLSPADCDGEKASPSSLHFLSVARNLLGGTVPATALQTCAPSLTALNLSGNHFSGELDFPTGIWNLTRLRTLDLSYNAFSGVLPGGAFSVHFLKELRLQGNQFSGALPADVGFCRHLKVIDFGENLFAGGLPRSLRALISLEFLRLPNNMLAGELPHWISNMSSSSSLRHVDFSGNGFVGTLPPAMGVALQSLQFLSLSGNKLTGGIPASLGSCTDLSVLRLRGNTLNGTIPSGLFSLGMEEIDLSENELTGPVLPASRWLSESLCKLDLSSNRLHGSIPPGISSFSGLRYLNLSRNDLRSQMPPELGLLRNLAVLDLRNSRLYGSVPGGLCNHASSLSILQLDGNSLTGPIPEEICNCSSLYLLSLPRNTFNGSIPKSISMLSKLRILRLEFNKLSGEIPPELGKLDDLLAVNVSYNRLIGRLPVDGIFQNLDRSSLEGNSGICSPLLKEPCKMNVSKPLVLNPNEMGIGNRTGGHENAGGDESSPIVKPHRHTFLSVSAIIAISAATLIAIGVIFISLVNVSARRLPAFIDSALESMHSSSSSRSGAVTAGRLVIFDSKSPLPQDWFSSSNISLLDKAVEIGHGVFGAVYMVPVRGGGEAVAIKRLVSSNVIQHPEDFDREVRILGKVRHPNVVAMRGYQWTPQLQLLVSDYVPNGSLQSKLHERPPSTPSLTWPNRLKIINGVANGLAHLHHSFTPPIIHGCIKPGNILLDNDCSPRISDFGLTRLVTRARTRAQDALGHAAAPELEYQSSSVNEKSDVYGFGMIVLQLVSGKRAVEYREEGLVRLCDEVKALVERGSALECVDSCMGGCPEEALPILKLGLVCTSHLPSSRPSMAEVVRILQVIRTPV